MLNIWKQGTKLSTEECLCLSTKHGYVHHQIPIDFIRTGNLNEFNIKKVLWVGKNGAVLNNFKMVLTTYYDTNNKELYINTLV